MFGDVIKFTEGDHRHITTVRVKTPTSIALTTQHCNYPGKFDYILIKRMYILFIPEFGDQIHDKNIVVFELVVLCYRTNGPVFENGLRKLCYMCFPINHVITIYTILPCYLLFAFFHTEFSDAIKLSKYSRKSSTAASNACSRNSSSTDVGDNLLSSSMPSSKSTPPTM